jgi:phosphatidylserine/phosphatidylglycerophosphate/cardiolipin synthase-like enzyme
MKLIVQPDSGVAPIVAAIKGARKSVEIAIFRFEHKAIEAALNEAAARGVRVTALIAFANRGGEGSLRKLELRLLDAGIIVARTADDLIRYHGKYILIDRRVLYVLSFNFTRLDIDHSRGFGVVTTSAACVKDAVKLFKADCTRVKYVAKADTFVVSPVNSRRVLGAFLRGAKKQLLVYDPKISDREMLRILQERAKAGVEIQVIGQVAGRVPYDVKKLGAMRLHTRTIVRDRRQAFVGSQSLRSAELDSRREVGLIVQDARTVKMLVETFESDWKKKASAAAKDTRPPKEADDESPAEASPKEMAKAVKAFTKELAPLANKVKKAVHKAVAQAGDDVLNDKSVKETMKKVAKQAVKEAVKTAVKEAKAEIPEGNVA